jgi:hypothetical protein
MVAQDSKPWIQNPTHQWWRRRRRCSRENPNIFGKRCHLQEDNCGNPNYLQLVAITAHDLVVIVQYVSRNTHIIHQEGSTVFASVKFKTLNLEPFNTLQPIHAKVMKIHIIMCTKKQIPHEKPTKVITRVSRFQWLTKFCTATTSLYMNNSRSGHRVEESWSCLLLLLWTWWCLFFSQRQMIPRSV